MLQILFEHLFYTFVILRNAIRVDICDIFLVYFVAIVFFTLTYIFVIFLLNLSFDKKTNITVQILYFRDRLLLLIKIVFYIQITKNKIII